MLLKMLISKESILKKKALHTDGQKHRLTDRRTDGRTQLNS